MITCERTNDLTVKTLRRELGIILLILQRNVHKEMLRKRQQFMII